MIGPLDTLRMQLRPLSLDDVDDLVALDADPAVMRFISGGAPTPLATQRRFLVDGNHRACLDSDNATT